MGTRRSRSGRTVSRIDSDDDFPLRRFCPPDRDSPNKLPCYDILQVGAFTELLRGGEIPEKYFVAAEWMIAQNISVEGTDVAGYTALQHSLSCISLVKSFRWSQMLLDANPTNKISAINHRNRYGATAMHEAVMSMRRPGETDLRGEVLDWLLENHANCDIPDNDGTSARTTSKHTPGFREKMEDWDELVTDGYACQFCRRGKVVGKGKAKAETIPGELRANLRCSACRLVSCQSCPPVLCFRTDFVSIDCSAECQKVSYLAARSVIDTDTPLLVYRWIGEDTRRNVLKNEMRFLDCIKPTAPNPRSLFLHLPLPYSYKLESGVEMSDDNNRQLSKQPSTSDDSDFASASSFIRRRVAGSAGLSEPI